MRSELSNEKADDSSSSPYLLLRLCMAMCVCVSVCFCGLLSSWDHMTHEKPVIFDYIHIDFYINSVSNIQTKWQNRIDLYDNSFAEMQQEKKTQLEFDHFDVDFINDLNAI